MLSEQFRLIRPSVEVLDQRFQLVSGPGRQRGRMHVKRPEIKVLFRIQKLGDAIKPAIIPHQAEPLVAARQGAFQPNTQLHARTP